MRSMVSRRMRPSPSIPFTLWRSILPFYLLSLQSWFRICKVRPAFDFLLLSFCTKRFMKLHQPSTNTLFSCRRLDLNWCTIVHLVLFNLSQSRMRKYYDLDSEIMPFLNEHWDCLQLHQLSDTQQRER